MSNGAGTGRGPDGPSVGPGDGAIGPVQPVLSPYLAAPVAAEPDWAALADENAREVRRRRRLRVVGAAVLATLVVGGITATAVSLSGGASDTPKDVVAAAGAPTTAEGLEGPDGPPPATGPAEPSPGASGTASTSAPPGASAAASAGRTTARPGAATTAGPGAGTPTAGAQPSAAAPRDPLTLLSDASTDTAPLDPGTLFAATTLTVDGRTWTRVVTDSDTTCWKTTTGGLGDVISAQACRRMLRATYATGNSSVTVGVAVFDHRAQADAAHRGHKGQVQGLARAGGIHWCITAGCPGTHAALGRYTYYTVAGTLNPGNNTADAVATAAAPDFAARTSAWLTARGQAAAAAAG